MDRDLLRFALPDGATLSDHPETLVGGPTMVSINGTAEHKAIAEKEQKTVMTDQKQWTRWATLALVLDFITIACILWLMGR